MAFSSPIEISMEILISAFPRRNGTVFGNFNRFAALFSNGANYTSVAASVLKLLVVFASPTQLGKTIAHRCQLFRKNICNYGHTPKHT